METGEYAGDDDFDPTSELYAQLASYVAFFINIVVMLNLLIAIISDRFESVIELN